MLGDNNWPRGSMNYVPSLIVLKFNQLFIFLSPRRGLGTLWHLSLRRSLLLRHISLGATPFNIIIVWKMWVKTLFYFVTHFFLYIRSFGLALFCFLDYLFCFSSSLKRQHKLDGRKTTYDLKKEGWRLSFPYLALPSPPCMKSQMLVFSQEIVEQLTVLH